MIKELTILIPYYKRPEIEYALDFIVRSKIIDNVSTEIVQVDRQSIFLLALKVIVEGKREKVIDRILGSLKEEYKKYNT